MKKLLSAILIICMLIPFGGSASEISEFGYNGDTGYVYFEGRLSDTNTGSFVTLLVKNESSTGHIGQYEVSSDGSYSGKFQLSGDISDYNVSLKAGNSDVTDTISVMRTEELFQVLNLEVVNENGSVFVESTDELYLSALLKNKYADENSSLNLLFAFYDKKGNLEGVSLENNVSLSYDVDLSISKLADKKLTEDTAKIKLFAWKLENLMPYAENYEKTTNNNVFGADGEEITVALAGDSIVHQAKLIRWIEHIYATRYPNAKVNFINKGIGGDTANGLKNRLEWDIFEHSVTPVPDVIISHVCTNDIGYTTYRDETGAITAAQQQRIDNCIASHKTLIDTCLDKGVGYIVLTPLMHDESPLAPKGTIGQCYGVNTAHALVAEGLREYATEKNLDVIDMHKYTTDIDEEIRNENPGLTEVLCNDSVHCGEYGAILAAYTFVADQGATDTVAEVVINANGGSVTAKNASVSGVTVSDSTVKYTYNPYALPIAATTEYKYIESGFGVDFTNLFNREIIRVSNLAEGTYGITIDGTEVGEYTSEELALGINIAILDNNPGQVLAKEIYALNKNKANKESGFRDIAAAYQHMQNPLKNAGVDINDVDAVESWITINVNDSYNDTAYWKGLMKSYPEAKRNEAAKWQEIQNIVSQIREKQVYNARSVVIEKK